jgi:flagellin
MPTINTNVAAIKARRNLDKVQRELDTSIARLSSGKRITRAHDDASGMAIAGRMESQIRGLTMNIKNAKDGQSLVDTQEGALQQVTALLQRMRELGVQAASGSVNQNTADKDSLQTENLALIHEILAIGANTKFNDKTILQGESFSFYTDIDVAGTAITTVTAALYTSTLNIATATVSIGGTEAVTEIKKTISIIDTAIATVANRRAGLGALSNRFDHIIDNLTNVVANTESARSRVEDADFAIETTQLTRNTVLQQAATSMVAQANVSKNTLLALIQG